jgi:acid phosphatase family membrane protein YuiD
MDDLLANRALWTAAVAAAATQALKVLIVLITERRWALDRLLETGGMPSSHSAAVTALAMSLGLQFGWGSPYFALATVFGLIVMYDATGIRRAAGVQAALINELVDELGHLFNKGFKPQALKTLLGHTYPQVLVGVLIGLVTAVVSYR